MILSMNGSATTMMILALTIVYLTLILSGYKECGIGIIQHHVISLN